ncbi:MAG: hypothetical protein WBA76_16545 [Phormidesmis sp.]
MNRYKETTRLPLSSSDPLSEHTGHPINLVKVRPGLTSSPQMSLADLQIYPTPYGLEMKFCLSRVRGSLIATALRARANHESTRLTLLSVVGMALFVGGSVMLTGSAVFGVIVAAILPVLFWFITLPEKANTNAEARLRLVNAPNGRTLLSLSAGSTGQHNSKDVVYMSNLSVRLFSAKTTLKGGQVSFTVYTDDPLAGSQIHITGSRKEVRWLHARIARWSKGNSMSMQSLQGLNSRH